MAQRHRLTRYTVLLSVAGLAINLLFSRLALHFSIPLYLDSIGTILSAMIGGYLPGIIVGFFSNVINGLSDPITLYYAIINILIACTAAFLAGKGWFSRPGLAALSVLLFSLIGGALGSVLTWLLYGFSFGSGISAPFAVALCESAGLSEFYAQFLADFAIDLADKLITVLVCFVTLRLLPAPLLAKLSCGRVTAPAVPGRFARIRRSLRGKVVFLIAASALILGSAATCIGYLLYTGTMTDHYIETAASVAELEASVLDAGRIDGYLSSLVQTDEYRAEEARLANLRESVPDVEYIYVYQIREDGCHVVFDIDTPVLAGGELGDVIPMEDAFSPYRDALLAGEEIPAVVSNGAYGWLLTAYAPVVDAAGRTVAYAAADISMADVMSDRAIFIIKMASLLFGVSIVIVAFALWFSEHRLVDPINAMAEAAADFAYDSEKERLETTARVQSLDIHTGDEIENLYGALKKTVTDVSDYITDISRKSRIIAQMQHNIILSFANMVENRDTNTGQHIKRTAAYVDVIARELYREGQYADTIDPAYIDKIVRSAPLHDLGKIEVPDAILNKPGRLTPEEFERIKAHTTAGRAILLGILENSEDPDYLSEAVNMAAYHHERWDGAGYPEGLRGDEIPVSARIMAVADVYDALLSKRSYKDAMPDDEATAIIRGEAGTHFDPVVVQAFLNAGDALRDASA